MSSTEKMQGSGAVNKSTLLQQVRGSMTCIEKLSPDNIAKVAEAGLSYERVRDIFNDAGIDIEKILWIPRGSFTMSTTQITKEGSTLISIWLRQRFLMNALELKNQGVGRTSAIPKKTSHSALLQGGSCLCYSISSRLLAGRVSSFLGKVSFRTPLSYLAFISSALTPEISYCLE